MSVLKGVPRKLLKKERLMVRRWMRRNNARIAEGKLPQLLSELIGIPMERIEVYYSELKGPE